MRGQLLLIPKSGLFSVPIYAALWQKGLLNVRKIQKDKTNATNYWPLDLVKKFSFN